MRFHSISRRDYKGIRFLKFKPREQGITIVEGENEAGKSSIAEALWLIFEQHDDSSSKLIQSIRPAGRDAATEIEIEVSTGPYRFTYFKRFHRSPRTELRVDQPKREHLAGREADERAKAILAETIDVALWSAMRVHQGLSLEVIAPGEHQSLLVALEVAAGQVLGGEREQSIYERVSAEYEKYFTGTGRERASVGIDNAPKLRQVRDDAMTEATRLANRISALEDRAGQGAAFESELVRLGAALEGARGALAELSACEAVRREQLAEVTALTGELRMHETAAEAASVAATERKRAIEAIAPRQKDLQDSTAQLSALTVPLEQSTAARAAAAEALERATELAAATNAERQAAEDRLELSRAEFLQETMAERLERLERYEPEMRQLGQWLSECKVDGVLMRQLDEAQSRVEQTLARRDAEGASIEVASEDGLDFEINGKPVRIEPGQRRKGTSTGESVISLPGGITITVRAGAGARGVAAEVTAAEEALAGLLSRAGVESLAGARTVMDERIRAEENRRGLEKQLKADLRDLGSAEELRQKLGRERARIAALRHQAGDARLTIDAAKAAVEAATRTAAAAELECRNARTALTLAESTLTGFERERAQLTERIDTLGGEVTRLETDLARRREEQPDQAIEAASRDHEERRLATAIALADATARLAELPDVTGQLEHLTAEVRGLEQESVRLREEIAGIRAVLEDAGADGLHGQLSEAEQALDGAQEELDSFTRRAAAAKLLFETLRRHRDRARENYAQPLRDKVEQLGRVMFGPTFEVELSDDLRIVRRTLDGIQLDVPQLSVGVREQLAIVTRLACASLVSSGGGAPLVLDDVLGWADPGRLRKFGPLLAEAVGDSQVLVFTCTPERFAAVAPARVISLPSGESFERESVAAVNAEPPRGAPSATAGQTARRTPEPLATPQAAFDLFSESEKAASRN